MENDIKEMYLYIWEGGLGGKRVCTFLGNKAAEFKFQNLTGRFNHITGLQKALDK